MEKKSDEKVKALALICAIVLILVLLFTRVSARLKEQQNHPPPVQASSRTVTQPPSVRTENTGANPFWTRYAVDSYKEADARAHPASAPAGGASRMAPGGIPAAVVSPPITGDLTLMGIITDGNNMAVIKVGEDMRYLPAGASIDPETRVVAIEAGKVTIVESGKPRILILGQTLARASVKEPKRAAELSAEPVPPSLPGFAEPAQFRPDTKINAGF